MSKPIWKMKELKFVSGWTEYCLSNDTEEIKCKSKREGDDLEEMIEKELFNLNGGHQATESLRKFFDSEYKYE